MKNKKIFCIIFSIIFFYSFCPHVYAAEPEIVGTIRNAFVEIKEWVLKIATPAAAVAVATGVFMKKFSFGDEERIRIGKKLIRSSLFSYAFILVIDLVLAAIESLLG